ESARNRGIRWSGTVNTVAKTGARTPEMPICWAFYVRWPWGWIDVLSFQFDSFGVRGGGNWSRLLCVCNVGEHSMVMHHYLLSGRRIPNGILECSKEEDSGKPSIFFRVRMTDISVEDWTSYRHSDPLIEKYELQYAGVFFDMGPAPRDSQSVQPGHRGILLGASQR
ncbi:MAG: hypothetical protein ACRC33_10980, partial [Gemmataceae bacterium]